MRNKILEYVENLQINKEIPNINVGSNVKIHLKIKEGEKERIQIFEGLIITIKGQGLNKTFTVRKISYGIGVEKTFLINSPLIKKIEIMRENKIRRAKLYYMRERKGKSARLKQLIKKNKK